jgi:hypothetical protein
MIVTGAEGRNAGRGEFYLNKFEIKLPGGVGGVGG